MQILQVRGKTVGPNLFHSFSAFDLQSNESAIFLGDSSIHNVIARVTSGTASNVNGNIVSLAGAGGAANLFLMNSAGWIFGPNAKLSVRGAFAATTADFLELADGARFNALPGATDAVLTSAAPAAFGFLGATPAGVSVASGNGLFSTQPGKSFAIVGGDITLNNAAVKTSGGRVSLVSVASPGRVSLSADSTAPDPVLSGFSRLGNIVMTASQVDASGGGGGRVVIRGGQLVMQGSLIASNSSGSKVGQGVNIVVTGLLEMKDSSQISSEVGFAASGDSGDIRITANQLRVTSGSKIAANSRGSGGSGLIDIAAGDLLVDGASTVSSDSFADGAAAGVKLAVDRTLTVQHGALVSARALATAPGGEIATTARNVALLDGSLMSSSTAGGGAGGRISLLAETLMIDGQSNKNFTGIAAETRSSSATGGHGGDISVETSGKLTIAGGGRISASTQGGGAGGNLGVRAGEILIEGTGTTLLTGITAQSRAVAGGGSAGNVTVQTSGSTSILGLGVIATDTFGDGAGGSVSLHARDLLIDRRDNMLDFPGVSALSRLTPSNGDGGRAGNIDVLVDRNLTIQSGGLIDSSTFGTGEGGNVTVHAGSVLIDRAGSEFFNGIGSDTGGAPGAQGGSVSVSANSITLLRGGLISTGTFGVGNAGNVSLIANSIFASGRGVESKFVVTPFSGIVASTTRATSTDPLATGNAGAVSIVSGSLFLSDSAQVASFSRGSSGSAGRVTLSISGALSLTGGSAVNASLQEVDKVGAPPPDISIAAGSVSVSGGSNITASTTVNADAGKITVMTNSLSLSGDGRIASLSQGSGNAGVLDFRVSSLSLTGRSRIEASTSLSGRGGGIQVVASEVQLSDSSVISAITQGSGNAGSIVVSARDVRLDSGGLISAATLGTGLGGDVRVTADGLDISGEKSGATTGISATSENRAAGGAGGQIQISARELHLDGRDATVTTKSFGSGSSGRILAQVGDLQLRHASNIQSASEGAGDSGSVLIVASKNITLTGQSSITTAARQSNAGEIRIEAGSPMKLTDSSITASAGRNGGSIRIVAQDLLFLTDSSLTATAGTVTTGAGAGGGSGGNIFADSKFIILDHSSISANAARGQGGNILLIAENFLPSESPITASGSTAGTVQITAPPLVLANALATLQAGFVDASTRLQERCTMRLGGDDSSFLAVGRGAVEDSPEDPQTEITERVRQRGKARIRHR